MRIRTMNPLHRGRGWLKNNNRPGDLSLAIRCGAKTRPGTPVRVRLCQMAGAGCMAGPVRVHEQQKDYSGLEGPIGRPGHIPRRQRLIAVWTTQRSGCCESTEFFGLEPAD